MCVHVCGRGLTCVGEDLTCVGTCVGEGLTSVGEGPHVRGGGSHMCGHVCGGGASRAWGRGLVMILTCVGEGPECDPTQFVG